MIPRINYYQFKPIDDTASLDAYKIAVDGVVKQYDKTLDDRDKLVRTLGSIQSNKFGNEYLTQLATQINKSLDVAATVATGSGKRWDLAENTVRELTNQVANDKVVQSLKLSHDNFLKGKETERELAKTGEVVNLSDEYDDYKPLNADGSVNIYNPLYQRKADNYGAIKKIAKDLPTEIEMEVSATQNVPGYLEINQVKRAKAGAKERLSGTYYKQYAESDEGHQQAILLHKQLAKQGLSEEQIQKRIKEEQIKTVKQSLDLYEQELFENKPQLINDVVGNRAADRQARLESWQMQQDYANQNRIADREDRQAERRDILEAQQAQQRWLQEQREKQQNANREDTQTEQERQIRLRAELAGKNAQAKAAAKASGKISQDNAGLISRSAGLNRTTYSLDGVTSMNNPEYLDAMKTTVDVKKGKGDFAWSGIAFNKDQIEDFDDKKDKLEVTGFRPLGITAYNESDPSFDGAWYGELTYKDDQGKEHVISANVRNTDGNLRNLYGDVAKLRKDQANLEKMQIDPKKGYIATEIRPANPNYFNNSRKPIYLQMIRTAQGVKVIPLIKGVDENGNTIWQRPARMASSFRNQLGLNGIKEQYSVEEMRNMADNDFLDTARARVLSKKQLSEIPSND